MDGRDPRSSRSPRVDGRPAFGLGPIARVPTMAALAGAGAARPPMGRLEAPPIGGRPQAPGSGPAPGSGSGGRGVPVIGPGTTAARSGPPARAGTEIARARAFGLPNLRRNVCPHFYMTGARGAIPIHAPHLLKALVRQDATTSRCQLRGGVHLEQGYVNDVCLSPRFNQCVFYEEDLTDH
ncbi:MAG: hypothetical protein AB1736_14360 [Chloroflexota bacterium]